MNSRDHKRHLGLSLILGLSLTASAFSSNLDLSPIIESAVEEEKETPSGVSGASASVDEEQKEAKEPQKEETRQEKEGISFFGDLTLSPIHEEETETGEEASPEEEFTAATATPTPVPDLPWSIQDFVTKYPQAISFATNYFRYKDNVLPINILPDLTEEGIPLFIQWDPRWGYRTYGSDFMGITGCGPTCLSMVVCGLTGNTEADPYSVACWSYDNGHYVYGAGTAWSLMSAGASHYGLCSESISLSQEAVLSSLRAGRPIITSVGPGIFTYFGHFILLTGLDENGNILLNDPNNPGNSLIPWDVSTILSQAVAMWSFWVP